MGFASIRAYADAFENGRTSFCSFRKVPSQATTTGHWADLTMAAGNPPPQYYANSPLVASVLDGQRGIFHGDAKSPATKHLAEIGLVTPTAGLVGEYLLADVLLYYPFVDLDDADTQVMDNTITLPRYTDGVGVEAILVAVAPTTGGGRISMTYIGSDGVERTQSTLCGPASTPIASVVTSQPAGGASGNGLFMERQSQGIRSVTSVQMSLLNGGLGALVLVRPLASIYVPEINTMSEVQFVRQRAGAPQIYDGAYLGLFARCTGSIAAGSLAGFARFAWST